MGYNPLKTPPFPEFDVGQKLTCRSIFEPSRVDRTIDVTQEESEDMTRKLAALEGIFAGISSGGALAAALQVSSELENSVIVSIVCDRGDRYLSTGVFPD